MSCSFPILLSRLHTLKSCNFLFLRSNGQAAERFSCPWACGGGDLKEIATQIGQLQTVENPPLAARLAGFLDDGAIDNPQSPRAGRAGQRDPIFLQQIRAQPPQPFLAVAQSLEQGHIGDIRQMCQLGLYGGFSQRKAIGDMQEQRPQQRLGRRKSTQPFDRATHPSALAPPGRKQGQKRLPIFLSRIFQALKIRDQ
jgi:hypothetical protein